MNGSPFTSPLRILPSAFNMSRWLPSACSLPATMPGVSEARITTAPAPSPNSTHVVRSFQSNMRDITSAPTTSAVLACPPRMYKSAVFIAYTKPPHTACMSNAALRFFIPSLSCRMQAVLGNTWSGVVVATITRSISSVSIPAAEIARRLACRARSLHISPSAAICRSSIPLRETIQSCEVSTIFSKSKLVNTFAGR